MSGAARPLCWARENGYGRSRQVRWSRPGCCGQAGGNWGRPQVGWQLEPGILAGAGRWWPWGVGAGVSLAAATWPYYGGYGYSEFRVEWVPDYGWVNVCNYPAYGGYGYY